MIQVPEPVLVTAVAPPPVGSTAPLPIRFAPVLVPVRVSVRLPVDEAARVVPVRTSAPFADADASIVAPLGPTVKSRPVLSPAPVYFRVPPSMTRFAALLRVELPIELFPAVPRLIPSKVPALTVVIPPYAFAALFNFTVP